MSIPEVIWVTVGGIGQACFGGRMILQWWVSERQKQSVIPVAFWYLSLVGGVMMLAYALWRTDPVFIAGQLLSLVIYIRNIKLFRVEQRMKISTPEEDPSGSSPLLKLRSSECVCPCTCGAMESKAA
jgi:lipid-A-disaccharide synthase-like uncharacterized protein